MNQEALRHYCEMYDELINGVTLHCDEILQRLKDAGASQGMSAFVLLKRTSLSIKEIDDIVVNSPVWRENKEMNDAWRLQIDGFTLIVDLKA